MKSVDKIVKGLANVASELEVAAEQYRAKGQSLAVRASQLAEDSDKAYGESNRAERVLGKLNELLA